MQEEAHRTRKCRTCGEDKPLSLEFFYRNEKFRSGLTKECKECTKARSRIWAEENKVRKSSLDREYAKRNSVKISDYQKSYRVKNKQKSLKYMEKYKEDKKDQLREARTRYNSRPEVKERRSLLHKERSKYDKKYRLMCNVRSSVSEALSKQSGALRFLEYSVDDLVKHLERQFLEGMTWDNYGTGWHVDHIVPSSSFSFESADDPNFKYCWGLANLRPLWANENLKKGAKRTFLI